MHRWRHPWLHRIVWLRRNRCSALLFWLCALILANPLFVSREGQKALALGLLVILLLATWALRVRWPVLLAVIGVAIVAGLAVVLSPGERHWLRPVAVGMVSVLTGAVTVALLHYVLDRHLITTDKVFGAVAAYVLIAISFTGLFNLLQLVQPNAFYIAAANSSGGGLTWANLMYFSFTVLTSTGFGEITPATDVARSLIMIEQVVGVMYVAFLIARLANLYGRSLQR